MRKKRLIFPGLILALTLVGCGGAQAARPAPPPAEIKSSPPSPAEASVPGPAEPFPEETAPDRSVPAGPALEEAVPEGTSREESAPPTEEGDYFDDTLFVGDSIMEGIRQYVAAQRQERELLGTAQFLTSTMGISLADLTGDRDWGAAFSYKGEERPLEDIVAELAPRRVFLLLGLNDMACEPETSADEIAARYARLIGRLRTACPETEFIIITNPPKVASQWLPEYTANRNFGNELIGAFVSALRQMCREHGVPYVDAYEALKDGSGALPDSFCRDGYVHLNHQGAAAVVDALEAFAGERWAK